MSLKSTKSLLSSYCKRFSLNQPEAGSVYKSQSPLSVCLSVCLSPTKAYFLSILLLPFKKVLEIDWKKIHWTKLNKSNIVLDFAMFAENNLKSPQKKGKLLGFNALDCAILLYCTGGHHTAWRK